MADSINQSTVAIYLLCMRKDEYIIWSIDVPVVGRRWHQDGFILRTFVSVYTHLSAVVGMGRNGSAEKYSRWVE